MWRSLSNTNTMYIAVFILVHSRSCSNNSWLLKKLKSLWINRAMLSSHSTVHFVTYVCLHSLCAATVAYLYHRYYTVYLCITTCSQSAAVMFTCDKCILPARTSLSTYSSGTKRLTSLIKISFKPLQKYGLDFHYSYMMFDINKWTDFRCLIWGENRGKWKGQSQTTDASALSHQYIRGLWELVVVRLCSSMAEQSPGFNFGWLLAFSLPYILPHNI